MGSDATAPEVTGFTSSGSGSSHGSGIAPDPTGAFGGARDGLGRPFVTPEGPTYTEPRDSRSPTQGRSEDPHPSWTPLGPWVERGETTRGVLGRRTLGRNNSVCPLEYPRLSSKSRYGTDSTILPFVPRNRLYPSRTSSITLLSVQTPPTNKTLYQYTHKGT